jgi:hypothetical protein
MTMAEAAKKLQEPPKKNVIRPSRAAIQLAEHSFRRHHLEVDNSVDPQADLEDPTLWENVASNLRLTDEVRVMNENQTWMANVLITFVNGTDVRARILDLYDIAGEEPNPGASKQYEVQLRGRDRWCVIKKETGEKVIKGIATEAAAHKELADYERALRS